MHKYTKEEKNFIRKNYHNHTNKELTKIFNEKFNTDVTVKAISAQGKELKLLKDDEFKGSFKKGHTPQNKGKKLEDYLNDEQIKNIQRTQFKKGHRPHNARPVGSERFGKDKYIYVKIGEPNIWLPKQALLYEKYIGEVPKGCKVIFADGNKYNFELDNLLLVTSEELLKINSNGFYYRNKEATKCGLNMVKIMNEIKKRKKGQ